MNIYMSMMHRDPWNSWRIGGLKGQQMYSELLLRGAGSPVQIGGFPRPCRWTLENRIFRFLQKPDQWFDAFWYMCIIVYNWSHELSFSAVFVVKAAIRHAVVHPLDANNSADTNRPSRSRLTFRLLSGLHGLSPDPAKVGRLEPATHCNVWWTFLHK